MHDEHKKVAYGKFETATQGNLQAVRVEKPAASKSITHPPGQVAPAINKWAVLILAASSGFLTTLDSSIVNIGLPAISNTFHVGLVGPLSGLLLVTWL
ncbi:hypothetical protein [Dictyobacter kobayashii]|uniref:Uncharacterized protein n=1 Tax=Dictyobacter kobayashii TaxID=2014872 RepID=A0A402ADY4_9CHLR|nr:hypothetical protein [Dictyobacter kobayashii]GCE17327.1 hypothetical protein KDK_11270 [Dictyobacter kobayashii]